MSLYLKYRPKTIDELDLASVREGLTRIVKSNQVSHAYLFTGPRGAGKTSAARILARVVNCEHNDKKLAEPCNDCDNCRAILSGSSMDVLEIDAASNRGIDDVRELKEKIGLAPSSLRNKVYIIDEVHMMTTEAFNALLKTLEEPPAHAVFILCTTEAHKVPDTIVSRTTRVLFTKATREEMMRSFERVIKGEKATVSPEALELLAKSVDGSFRDGVKILEQVLGAGEAVGTAEMEQALTGAVGFRVDSLVQALANRELDSALSAAREAITTGVDLGYLLTQTMRGLRDLVVKEGETQLVPLIYKLDETTVKLSASPVSEILVEMVVVEWCTESENPKSQNPTPKQIRNLKQETKREQSAPSKKEVAKTSYQGTERDLWREMLKSLNGDSYSLGALLSKARPGLMSGDQLTIQVEYEFHREQIMAEKHRVKIEDLVSKVVGQPMRISCEVNTAPSLQSSTQIDTMTEPEPEQDSLLDEAVEIFS